VDAVVGAIVGGFAVVLTAYIAHRLAAARDRDNRRREARNAHLLDAFVRLEHILDAGLHAETDADFRHALLDIQIFGSAREGELVRRAILDFVKSVNERKATTGSARGAVFDVEDLRKTLLSDLRSELLLDPDVPTPLRVGVEWTREPDQARRNESA
jgi:hypothetical protein